MGNNALLLEYLRAAYELGIRKDSRGFMNLIATFQKSVDQTGKRAEELETDTAKISFAFTAGLTGNEEGFRDLVRASDESLAREVYGILMRRELELGSRPAERRDDKYRELLRNKGLRCWPFVSPDNVKKLGRRESPIPVSLVSGTFSARKVSLS
ncbi:hypothetical protein HY570_04240 [Candidatus Micrarchaeota archaeon]|nr:hypothetical protein [Candidatus Micrarchaeota archaeon]